MRSMTGYGQARVDHRGERFEARAKSVNHRFLKVDLRLGPDLRFCEPWVETLCRERLARGTVEVEIRRKPLNGARLARISADLLAGYHKQLTVAARKMKIAPDVPLSSLLSLPGVVEAGEDEVDLEAARPSIERVVREALEDLCAMRGREGGRLVKVLRQSVKRIREVAAKVSRRAPEVPPQHAARLRERLAALLAGTANPVEPEALAREVAIFADRCDIAEEIQRLDSHCMEFDRLCGEEGDLGKKLDYLAQEMAREANTMGSKANDAEIARWVIELKTEIERIREQVQNVE
ncbi:MAG: YicC family protein [Planctomycetes bacterium]|nr:YicC family protein [Planctomycetota bacterium]